LPKSPKKLKEKGDGFLWISAKKDDIKTVDLSKQEGKTFILQLVELPVAYEIEV